MDYVAERNSWTIPTQERRKTSGPRRSRFREMDDDEIGRPLVDQ